MIPGNHADIRLRRLERRLQGRVFEMQVRKDPEPHSRMMSSSVDASRSSSFDPSSVP